MNTDMFYKFINAIVEDFDFNDACNTSVGLNNILSTILGGTPFLRICESFPGKVRYESGESITYKCVKGGRETTYELVNDRINIYVDSKLIRTISFNEERWYNEEGNLHRDRGCAVTISPGHRTIEFWLNGQLHNATGPAVVNGDSYIWYRNGVIHRDGGPAIKTLSGCEKYYREGKLHRLLGPAVIHTKGLTHYYMTGETLVEYWEDGEQIQ